MNVRRTISARVYEAQLVSRPMGRLIARGLLSLPGRKSARRRFVVKSNNDDDDDDNLSSFSLVPIQSPRAAATMYAALRPIGRRRDGIKGTKSTCSMAPKRPSSGSSRRQVCALSGADAVLYGDAVIAIVCAAHWPASDKISALAQSALPARWRLGRSDLLR